MIPATSTAFSIARDAQVRAEAIEARLAVIEARQELIADVLRRLVLQREAEHEFSHDWARTGT